MGVRAAAAVSVFAVVVVLAACGSSPTIPEFIDETHYPTTAAARGAGVLAVAGDVRRLVVVTQGSSSCPMRPASINWDDSDELIEIALLQDARPDEPCTADDTFTASEVQLPADAPDLQIGATVLLDGQRFVVEQG